MGLPHNQRQTEGQRNPHATVSVSASDSDLPWLIAAIHIYIYILLDAMRVSHLRLPILSRTTHKPMAAVANRKRPAPDDGACAVATTTMSNKKRAPCRLRSIHEYEQLEVLGKGSYGVVVKARDRLTGETVAIKSNLVGGADDLIREASFLAVFLGHPSIVQIRGVAADDADDGNTNNLFLVMEFVGPSLRTVLVRQRRRFSEAEAREPMRQLLGAATKLHGAKMIHRDIKPGNILVGDSGELKLCDFGTVTKAMRDETTPYPEERVGTMLYRSPEQLRGIRCYGPAVDVWALGCVMYELLAGEPLFGDAWTEEDVLIAAGNLRDDILYYSSGPEAFGRLPEPLSPSGAEVLCGLLCFDHEQRFTAAEALGQRWFTEGSEAELSALPWQMKTAQEMRPPMVSV
ncbi:hypothetical protein HU200_059991 [Digitaria exilis]|uniref:[RNA-polymerase]-subunit kinase n=1 Tax=Digitaria exilis TaxID=1010633 RepID=A0A835E0P1_9POAL|nr:hypothetical protein HU200_059991 [Digitaria exilis]